MYSLRECCDKPIDGKDRQDIMHSCLPQAGVVGLPHIIEEVRESGWREGGSGNAEGFKGDIPACGRQVLGIQNWGTDGNEI